MKGHPLIAAISIATGAVIAGAPGCDDRPGPCDPILYVDGGPDAAIPMGAGGAGPCIGYIPPGTTSVSSGGGAYPSGSMGYSSSSSGVFTSSASGSTSSSSGFTSSSSGFTGSSGSGFTSSSSGFTVGSGF